jgi:hypothetical protein
MAAGMVIHGDGAGVTLVGTDIAAAMDIAADTDTAAAMDTTARGPLPTTAGPDLE